MPSTPPKSNKRNRRRTGPDEYEAILDSHRVSEGGHQRAAEAAGVSYNTARKVYEKGLGPEFPAVRSVLEREKAEAREVLRESGRREQQLREETVRARAAVGVEERAL